MKGTAETTARQKFHVRQRVKPSRRGLDAHLGLSPADRATVMGFGRVSTLSVWVLKDGRKTRTSYHAAFWEPA